jgi:tetratricopeptide (TPR) repeat protein
MADEIDELVSRLARYPAARYPAQHATAQFHVGAARLQAGDVDASLEALGAASGIFGELGMRLEDAKAMMLQGAALRAVGRHGEAATVFGRAGDEFRRLDKQAEEAAALFNLGLVLAASEELTEAAKSFAAARQLFVAAGQRVWAGAAAREHGAVLVSGGDAGAAVPLLEEAVELLGAAEPAGAGAAANVLGLARLSLGQPDAAVDAFQDALGWHPRSVRPAEHAMAKANLALAHEAAGAGTHARVCARHALGVPQAPEQVRASAQQVLVREGESGVGDLFAVLDSEPVECRATWLRDELLLWTAVDAASRVTAAEGWVHEQVARGAEGVEQAELLLGVLLELPPPAYELVVDTIVRAVRRSDQTAAERFRSVTGSAMARYPLPQWQRLAATFTAAEGREGGDEQWS